MSTVTTAVRSKGTRSAPIAQTGYIVAGVLPVAGNSQSSMNPETRVKANEAIVTNLQNIMGDSRIELKWLRLRLWLTYWLIVILSVIMFSVGIVLLSIPALAAVQGQSAELQSLIAAGFGLADLATLFLFKPIERIHRLMGDVSQMSVTLTGFQTQVQLKLMEMDAEDRPTIGQSTDAIGSITSNTIKLIQDYFETASA